MRHLVAALLIVSAPVLAENYCVDSSAEILSAIASASSSPGPSEVRIVQGVYDFTAPSPGAAAIITSDNTGLKIVGGYAPGCSGAPATLNPELTLLRVGNTGRLLDMVFFPSAAGDIEISRLGLRQGTSNSATLGGCLNIEGDVGASITVRLSHLGFRLCGNTVGGNAALRVLGRDLRLELVNSVFADNFSQAGVIGLTASGNSIFYVTNNTIAFNGRSGAPSGPAGMQITNPAGNGFFWITNNLIYGNGGASDTDILYSASAIGVVGSNIIGRSNPPPAGIAGTGNSTANPLLASSVNLRLPANSPARNVGNNSAAGGLPTLDFDGNTRLQGGRVDLGAFEFEELFANGFE